jgi:hypothetical protein
MGVQMIVDFSNLSVAGKSAWDLLTQCDCDDDSLQRIFDTVYCATTAEGGALLNQIDWFVICCGLICSPPHARLLKKLVEGHDKTKNQDVLRLSEFNGLTYRSPVISSVRTGFVACSLLELAMIKSLDDTYIEWLILEGVEGVQESGELVAVDRWEPFFSAERFLMYKTYLLGLQSINRVTAGIEVRRRLVDSGIMPQTDRISGILILISLNRDLLFKYIVKMAENLAATAFGQSVTSALGEMICLMPLVLGYRITLQEFTIGDRDVVRDQWQDFVERLYDHLVGVNISDELRRENWDSDCFRAALTGPEDRVSQYTRFLAELAVMNQELALEPGSALTERAAGVFQHADALSCRFSR